MASESRHRHSNQQCTEKTPPKRQRHTKNDNSLLESIEKCGDPEADHIFLPPSDESFRQRSTACLQQPHKTSRGFATASGMLTKNRWPVRTESNDNNKPAHTNVSRNVKRRSVSSDRDSKLENKEDLRQYRKHKSTGIGMGVKCIELDRDSSRDSDTNLLIENMRNRECEIVNKITNNNGYYCCSSSENDDLIYFIRRRNSVANGSGLSHGNANKRRSPRSKTIQNNFKTLELPNKIASLNKSLKTETEQSVVAYQTEEFETKRKVKFTIRISKTGQRQNQSQLKEYNSHFDDKCAEETTDLSEILSTPNRSFSETECEELSSPTDDNLDRSDEFYDCFGPSIENLSDSIASTCSSVYEDAMESPSDNSDFHCQKSKNTKPIISIVQELTANNVINSSIQIDKEQVRAFRAKRTPQTPKKGREKRSTIIGDNFFGEVLSSLEEKHIIPNQNFRRKSADFVDLKKEDVGYSEDSMESSIMSDIIITERLESNPKYTGKSIGRLLAIRLEKNQALRTSRKISLQNYPNRRETSQIPPVKPPRSFTFSSASSPSSKQSSDGVISATTVPIGELFAHESVSGQRSYNEVFEPSFKKLYGLEEPGTQFGWVSSVKESDNNSMPRRHDTKHFGWIDPNKKFNKNEDTYNGERNFGWVPPMKISENLNEPNECARQRLEQESRNQILNMLHYEQYQPTHTIQSSYSKPQAQQIGFSIPEQSIDTVDNSMLFDRFSNELFPCSTPFNTPVKGAKGRGTNIFNEGQPERSIKFQIRPEEHFEDNGLKFGKEAPASKEKGNTTMRKTKALFGVSKKFLRKPLQNKSPKKSLDIGCNINSPRTTKTDQDNTVRLNSESYNSHNYEKRLHKNLSLTPKKINQVDVQESPIRDRNLQQQKFQRDAATQMVEVDHKSDDKLNSNWKISPTHMINKLTKTPKKLFRSIAARKHPIDPALKDGVTADTFYKSFNRSNEKVPLMGEILNKLRETVEAGGNISPSARKSLFRSCYESSEALDKISDQIAEIDLHDEPEPLYAEVGPTGISIQNKPSYSHADAIDRTTKPKATPVDIKEVYISSGNEFEPLRKYIMVNNDPTALYATVNAKSDKSISRESLHINIVNDFAQSVENMLDQQFQGKMNDMLNVKALDNTEYVSKSPSITDYYSERGLSESELGDASKDNRHVLFLDNTSLDTFHTDNLYETITSGNNLTDEITEDIDILENSPIPFDQISSEMEDYGYTVSAKVREDENMLTNRSSDSPSGKIHELYRDDIGYDTVDFEIKDVQANVGYLRESAHTSKKSSPNYKKLKNKLRNSVRKSKTYLKEESKKLSELLENSLTKKSKLSSTTSPRSKIRRKRDISELLRSAFNQSHDLSNGYLQEMITQLSQQIEAQDQIRNALDICRTTKEFENSRELVEAECLGLISHLKEMSAKDELDRIYYDEELCNYSSDLHSARLAINSLRFILSEETVSDTQFNYFYMCTCTYRGKVQSTAVEERKGNRVSFNNCKFQFKPLEPKFKVRLDVYVLRLRKNMFQNGADESIYLQKVKRKELSSHGLSTSKYNEYPASPANVLLDSLETSSDISRFSLFGTALLTSFDLYSPAKVVDLDNTKTKQICYETNETKAFDFAFIEDGNHLTSKIDIAFKSEVIFIVSAITGFLNIADCNSNWNRRWCCLDGFYMKFWNYPQDYNTMMPVATINLAKCVCENIICPADREVCPKPRSFIVEILNDQVERGRRFKKFFISADNSSELNQWLSEINRIIAFLRNWHLN